MSETLPVGTSGRNEPDAFVRITVEHPALTAVRTAWVTCAGG